MDEGYILLIRAIVRQAVKDYRQAVKRLRRCQTDYQAEKLKREVERFVQSDWFYFLTGMDADTAIKELKNGLVLNEDKRR